MENTVEIRIIDHSTGWEFTHSIPKTTSDLLVSAVLESIGYNGDDPIGEFIRWMVGNATEVKEQLIRSQAAQQAALDIAALRESLDL